MIAARRLDASLERARVPSSADVMRLLRVITGQGRSLPVTYRVLRDHRDAMAVTDVGSDR